VTKCQGEEEGKCRDRHFEWQESLDGGQLQGFGVGLMKMDLPQYAIRRIVTGQTTAGETQVTSVLFTSVK
jgi:hypothetical protein